MSIQASIQSIVEEQLKRVISKDLMSEQDATRFREECMKLNISPSCIDSTLASDLASLLQSRSDAIVGDSTRCGGYGKSTDNIQHSMRRTLHSKLQAVSALLRKYCGEQVEID